MGKDSASRAQQSRLLVAQQAARMMAEEGISDYAFAKRKAARQLGMEEGNCLPTNAEVESELRTHQGIYRTEEHAAMLYRLRSEALRFMRMLDRFDPHLTGAVLDGTAGRYAETELHLFADSDKEVEIFLLNSKIPYQTSEKSYHYRGERRKMPMFILDGQYGSIKLIVFTPENARMTPRNVFGDGAIARARSTAVEHLLNESHER